nr:MAG TPA: hypothetical protein [Caudoviricetes sp.]
MGTWLYILNTHILRGIIKLYILRADNKNIAILMMI